MPELILLQPNAIRPVRYEIAITIGGVPEGITESQRVDIPTTGSERFRGFEKPGSSTEDRLSASGYFEPDVRHVLGVKVYIRFHSDWLSDGNRRVFFEVMTFLRRRDFDSMIVISEMPRGVGLASTSSLARAPRPKRARSEAPNPAKNADVFDLMRQLDGALKELSREIGAINDPERQTTEIRSVRAYIDAFRTFLDDREGKAPDAIPQAIPTGTRERVARLDWSKISDAAQKWADLIVRIVDKLF